MNTIKNIFKWVFGVSFLLTGLTLIKEAPVGAILSIILGLFLIPPILKVIEQKANLNLSSGIKWGVTIVGLILVYLTTPIQESDTANPIQEKETKEINKTAVKAKLPDFQIIDKRFRKPIKATFEIRLEKLRKQLLKRRLKKYKKYKRNNGMKMQDNLTPNFQAIKNGIESSLKNFLKQKIY